MNVFLVSVFGGPVEDVVFFRGGEIVCGVSVYFIKHRLISMFGHHRMIIISAITATSDCSY